MRGDEMSADEQWLDPSWHRRSASLPPGRSRRWPVRRPDLELFLSTLAQEHRQRQEIDHSFETERGNPQRGDARWAG